MLRQKVKPSNIFYLLTSYTLKGQLAIHNAARINLEFSDNLSIAIRVA